MTLPSEVLSRLDVVPHEMLELFMRHDKIVVTELLIRLLDREVGQVTVLIAQVSEVKIVTTNFPIL